VRNGVRGLALASMTRLMLQRLASSPSGDLVLRNVPRQLTARMRLRLARALTLWATPSAGGRSIQCSPAGVVLVLTHHLDLEHTVGTTRHSAELMPTSLK